MGADPQTSNVADNNKVAISMGILVVIIAIIIIAVWCTNRVRAPVVVPLAVRNQRRREEETYRKEMEHFVLDSLPVFRYSTRLQWRLRKACRANSMNDLETGTGGKYSSNNKAECADDSKEHNISSEATATAQSTVKGTEQSGNPMIIQSRETESSEAAEQHSKDSAWACSVCTEDFAENDAVRILPCGHIYHRRCIDPWLLRFGGNCPLCRQPLQYTYISHMPLPERPRPARLS